MEHTPSDGADDGVIVGGGALDLHGRDQRVGEQRSKGRRQIDTV